MNVLIQCSKIICKTRSNISMLHFTILVINRFIMNSIHSKHSPESKYPAIELDMTDFAEHLSEEYGRGKTEVTDHVKTIPTIIDCKTEDSTDFGETSPRSELEQKEGVIKYIFYIFVRISE